jgi:hypothetical protein
MRESNAAMLAARKQAEDGRDQATVRLVCLALALSLIMLACRIFSVW